jgi:putative flippase GtrA
MEVMLNHSFTRFLLVGALNTCVGLSISFAMLNVFGLNYWTSTFVGNTVGAVVSYVLNRRFTFRSAAAIGSSSLKFAIVVIGCYFVSYGAGLRWTSAALSLVMDKSSPFVHNAAILAGNGLYMITNYVGHRYFTFRDVERLSAGTGLGSRRISLIDVGFLAVGAGLILWLLMLKPFVGIADNGDFQRIMATVGLDYGVPHESFSDRFYGYFHSQYRFREPGLGGYISTEIPVVLLAVLLNLLLYSGEVFDIRFLAGVYGVLLLAALYGLMKTGYLQNKAVRWFTAALSLFVFFDLGYIAYFNSLFGEPVSLVFLLLTVILGIRILDRGGQGSGIGLLTSFIVCAVFLIGSKVQNAPVGLMLALFAWRLRPLYTDRAWKRRVTVASAVLLLCSVLIYVTAPRELRTINQYQSVFYGILKDSPHPEKDLEELGLDPKLAVLAGTNYFTPNTPIPQQSPELTELFYKHISHGKIAEFYVTHPARFWKKLEATASSAFTIRPLYLGNYEQSAARGYRATFVSFDEWSRIKHELLPHSFYLILAFYAFYYGVLIRRWLHSSGLSGKLLAELFMLVGVIGAVSYVVPVLGDGEADLAKHLFMFNACFDLMLVISLVWMCRLAVHRFCLQNKNSRP